jgi:hypothetical protein
MPTAASAVVMIVVAAVLRWRRTGVVCGKPFEVRGN